MESKKSNLKEYWERKEAVSLHDANLRKLEQDAIIKWLEKGAKVLDVGCGDGLSTLVYAQYVNKIIGIDYSDEMLGRANKNLELAKAQNVRFIKATMERLDSLITTFDIIITERGIINLPERSEQFKAISDIKDLLNPNGLYIMLECTEQGENNINSLRGGVGLQSIPKHPYNLNFDLDDLLPFLESKFTIRHTEDFSLYFFITLVLNPLLGLNPYTDTISKKIDTAARLMHEKLHVGLQDLGPHKLFILQKNEA